MKKIPIAIILLLFIATSFVACGTADSALSDTQWLLISYGEQGELNSTIEGTVITALFNDTDNSVNGSAGCNTYFAQYDTDGNGLSVYEMAYTEMYYISPEGVMEQEQIFLALLSSAESHEASDTTLVIFCSGGQQLHFAVAT